jgi:hypothetical protein
MMSSKTTKLRLTIDVEYEDVDGQEVEAQLVRALKLIPDYLGDSDMYTGDTEASVADWDYKVESLSATEEGELV